jgi:hypothetical protein
MNIGKVNWLLLAGVALLLTGCTTLTIAPGESVSPLAQPEGAATGAANETPPASPTSSGVPVTGIPGDLLNAVLADASERTGQASDALVVTQAEAVTWNDGSLGCPEPGMFYTQALVDGYQIVVAAGDERLDYRVQSSGFFRLCEQNLPRGG